MVIYNVGMPYASSWDLLEAIRMSPALQSQPFVITTPDKGNSNTPWGHARHRDRGRDTDCVDFSKRSKQRQTVSDDGSSASAF